MPTPGADAVAELPQLSPECNNSNGVGRIGVALERPSGDLGGGPIRKNREFTMRTSQSLSILAITTALATTGWAIPAAAQRSEEHTSELQSLMRISYAVFCLTKKTHQHRTQPT